MYSSNMLFIITYVCICFAKIQYHNYNAKDLVYYKNENKYRSNISVAINKF